MASPLAAPTARQGFTSILVALFVISLVIPIQFYAGPLRLSPYRVVLIALFIPCVLAWLSGQLGKVRAPDVLILLSALWSILALMVNHGFDFAWQFAGMLLIETFGSYLLARMLIRNQDQFRVMVRTVFWLICVMLPFAVVEALTNRALFQELLGHFATVPGRTYMEMRHGFYRAQVGFEHSILYGVFAASGFGLVYYVMGTGKTLIGRAFRTSFVLLAALCSFSAGAVASLLAQTVLIGWDHITQHLKNRWRLLGILFIAAYVFVDLFSNRTPFHVFITYLTFSEETGYGRIMIFNWGMVEVKRQPLLGIGLGEWERPWWKSSSMDNFWLVVAVRYGVPAFVMLAAAVLLIMRSLGQLRIDDERTRSCRAGILISLGGLVIAAATVHYWNAIYVWFLFLIGSGVWMLDSQAKTDLQPRPGAVAAKEIEPARPARSMRSGAKRSISGRIRRETDSGETG